MAYSPGTLRRRARGLWRHFVLRQPPLARDGDWSEYYDSAEADAASQWLIIEPFLSESPRPDLSIVLDFACGRGRIAERFADISGKVICADMSEDAIERCRQRFAKRSNVEYLVNGNGSIPVPSGSITFLYSWDAMVHFSAAELEEYFVEFKRVLKPDGMGLIHHSNYAALSSVARPWLQNPGSRAYVSAEDVRRICEKCGLILVKQQVIDWSQENLDCITVLKNR
jgi:ubiquinone/menaquinone biosynthesis C-methylase UbiE